MLKNLRILHNWNIYNFISVKNLFNLLSNIFLIFTNYYIKTGKKSPVNRHALYLRFFQPHHHRPFYYKQKLFFFLHDLFILFIHTIRGLIWQAKNQKPWRWLDAPTCFFLFYSLSLRFLVWFKPLISSTAVCLPSLSFFNSIVLDFASAYLFILYYVHLNLFLCIYSALRFCLYWSNSVSCLCWWVLAERE